jgi:DNA polymerase epsilon subunit 1
MRLMLLPPLAYFRHRDPALQRLDWSCPSCLTERDVGDIEGQLVAALAAEGDAYQLQDLKCIRCSSVATNHLQRACDVCSGSLRNALPAKRTRQRITVYRNVAEFQEMETLKEVADWHLGQTG